MIHQERDVLINDVRGFATYMTFVDDMIASILADIEDTMDAGELGSSTVDLDAFVDGWRTCRQVIEHQRHSYRPIY